MLGAIDGDVTVKVAVCTEFFDYINLDLEALVLVHGEVFGTNTNGDSTSCLLGYFCVNLRNSVSEFNATRNYLRGEQVHGGGANEACNELVCRAFVEVTRSTNLLEQTILENRNAVTHGQRLNLVVSHVDGGNTETTLE